MKVVYYIAAILYALYAKVADFLARMHNVGAFSVHHKLFPWNTEKVKSAIAEEYSSKLRKHMTNLSDPSRFDG